MNNHQTFKSKSTCKKILTLVFILFALCLTTHAQNVTISPSSGKLVAGLTYDGEIGFQNGWSSLWRHNQLPLTLTVSDKNLITESGVLKDPAGDIILDVTQNLYVLMSGSPLTTEFHMGISLPKGYRFTGYRIVLLNNKNGESIGGLNVTGMDKVFYETDENFDFNNYKKKTDNMPAQNEAKEYVIERTSMTETDMGNNLYFLMHHTVAGFYAVTMKSCELYFTAEGAFDASVNPGKPTNIISEGVNMVGSAFMTSKLDLGEIKPHTKNGKTFYSYNFNNVKELTAQNWLYQEDAVTADKKLPATAGSGSIQALKNDNKLYYALGNNTYYIETPTSTKSQDGTNIPLGYRITGAKIKYHYGTEAGSQYVNENGDGQSVSGDIRFGSSYLRRDATWGRSQGSWEFTADGKLRNRQNSWSSYHYLYVHKAGDIYYVYSTTDANQASTFSISGNHIKYGSLFLVHTDANNPQLTTSDANAATWNPSPNNNVLNPAFKPSPYTLKIYKTNKDNVTQTVNVTEGDDSEVVLTNLNNDAIKFQVEGLEEGTKALITFELTLEALNPFINSIDIVCHSLAENGPTLMQQFTSNDFQVSGGKFIFYVPQDFFGGGEQKCRFTFENLYSKYGDNTYGNADPHHARYFFVKSPYYNTYNGQQYSTTGNEPAADKIHSEMCGDKPFKYSNIDELDPSNTSGGTTTLEEYPYSEALYMNQGGSFSSNIVLAVNQEKPCYLFTSDETRWNIAPTTAWEHRYYAYYLMDLKLETKDYVAKCELTKLYNTTCYNNGAEADLPMYGGVFKALDANTGAEIPSESAYLTVPMMKQALINELAGAGATGKQVLYLDYTNLYSVHIPEKTEMDAMKAELNPNCLIFFPVRSSFNEDNYIQKKLSGAFLSCRNIVITDRQPFYSPYKITVPAENYATYTRQITIPKNGKVANATLILPFALDLQVGTHTNRDGLCSFTVSKMNASNCLAIAESDDNTPLNYIGNAYFSPITESKTEANVPYMVKVLKAPTDNAISFIATQYGAEVISTKNSNMESDYTFKGESATGTIAGSTYNFTNYGSYSGKKVNKDEQIFYFSGNMYLNSKNLHSSLQYVYVYPFRSYYKYSGGLGAKIMKAFNVLYGENDLSTGIGEVTEKPDLAIIAGRGSLTFTTTTDRQIKVLSTDGTTVNRLSMNAGETRTITLPAGVYIVNGKKIIVK
ncbi:hypothetical protein [Prevotella sp. OH937_COT-195]|uniref:hypothetical protein n=1 Tax=Prevotella sp. OH937_COT-195 TaxID=2491051 RepID=UPI0018F37BBE|nr:hypothetical protein [Prevotella sp. OH937_COT-195]